MKKCTECNLNYENDEKFCKNCGTPLTENNSVISSKSSNTSFFLMLIIACHIFAVLIYLFINKLIAPHYIETHNAIALNSIYNYTGLFIALITLSIMGVAFFKILEKKIKLFIGICFIIMFIYFIQVNMNWIF
ncbi:MAG: hypothetical protein WCL51_12990 [Bacteroidota bacterium]